MRGGLVDEMKSFPATFKLGSSEWFRQNVSRLLLSWNKVYFDGVIFDFLSCEMKVYLEMPGFLMKHGVVAKFYATLIVTEELGWSVAKNF